MQVSKAAQPVLSCRSSRHPCPPITPPCDCQLLLLLLLQWLLSHATTAQGLMLWQPAGGEGVCRACSAHAGPLAHGSQASGASVSQCQGLPGPPMIAADTTARHPVYSSCACGQQCSLSPNAPPLAGKDQGLL